MAELFTTDALISLLTLTFLEIVLGIDNVVFIAIIAGKVDPKLRQKAQNWGLVLALIPRVILLIFISWIVGLEGNVVKFTIFGTLIEITQKGLVLLIGGLFLLYKSTTEIHDKLEGAAAAASGQGAKKKHLSFAVAIVQIILLNLVFSFDSILTAVGLVRQVEVMVIAVVIALLITLIFVNKISNFVEKHPTMKMLALSFLLLIGFILVVESVTINGEPEHIPKGYIYFAMAFSLFVEILNLRLRKPAEPVKLKTRFEEE